MALDEINSFEDIKKLMDKSYTLIYVDYRDNLNDNLKLVQESIQEQEWEHLDLPVDEWFMDNRDYGMDYAIKELQKELASHYEITDWEAEAIIEQYIEEIRETLWERDDSDPLGELIRHTNDPVTFYDTGEEIDFDIPFGTDTEMKDCLKQVKKALGIKLKETKWDSQLKLMIQQGYSGRLVIFFTGDIKEMMSLHDKKKILFENPNVAIINTWNGHGDDCQLVGHKFSLPLSTEELYLDKCVHYSYTYDVCGMSSNWCDGTKVTFK